VEKKKNLFLQVIEDNWERFKKKYSSYATVHYDEVIEKVLGCGDPEFGYVKFQCMNCGQDSKTVAFSCKSRFCLRCGRVSAAGFVEEIRAKLHPCVVYRHLILTIPEQLRVLFYENRQSNELFNLFFQAGWSCVQDVLNRATRCDLRCGCLMVIHTVGRKSDYKPHLHILLMDGGIDRETGEWVELGYFPYSILHKKWQYHLLTMMKEFSATDEVKALVDQLWKQYPNGFVGQILKGEVPKKMSKLTKYLSKYLFRPSISLRRIKKYDPIEDTVVYEYNSHETKKMETETISVLGFLGRMVQQILPKGFQRIRYYGLQATASYQKSKERIQEAMIQIRKSSDFDEDPDVYVEEVPRKQLKQGYAERIIELTGRDPLRCSQCGTRMEAVQVWYFKKGFVFDLFEKLKKSATGPPAQPKIVQPIVHIFQELSNQLELAL
jgi:Putative transposase/Transposase zinc-binding domain